MQEMLLEFHKQATEFLVERDGENKNVFSLNAKGKYQHVRV